MFGLSPASYAAVAGALVLGPLLAGCGGPGGGATSTPTPDASPSLPVASVAAFCATYADLPPALAGPAGPARLQAARELGRTLLATGVPASMPASARRGFAVYQHAMMAAGAGRLEDLLRAHDPSDVFSASTAAEVAAYTGYVRTTCITHATLAPTPTAPSPTTPATTPTSP